MREFEYVEVKEEKTLPLEVTCNKCGITKKLKGENPNDTNREFESNMFQEFSISFGYGSKFDSDWWNFDLCEGCLVEIVRSFEHLPEGYDNKYADKVFPIKR